MLIVVFHSITCTLMDTCVHMCAEDEEKREERVSRDRKEEYLVSFFFPVCASTAVSLTDWSKSGSCMACAQISQVSSGISALRVLKIRYFIL